MRKDGRDLPLHAEGWPERNREGRSIGLQRLKIVLDPSGSLSVFEYEKTVFESEAGVPPIKTAYPYPQVTSRSNYLPREVFFSNVQVEAGPGR